MKRKTLQIIPQKLRESFIQADCHLQLSNRAYGEAKKVNH